MNNVNTDRRLAEITVRRAPGRSAVLAFAAGAAMVLIVGAAFFAFRPTGGGPDTVPPATQTTSAPAPTTVTTTPGTTETTAGSTTTEGSDTTGVSTTSVVATPLPDLLPGMTLVANPAIDDEEPTDGVVGFVTSGIATVGFDVDRVVSDTNGGVFFQVGNTIGWLRRDVPAVNLFSAEDLPIGEPVDLRLEDVAVVDGQVNIIFIVAGGEEEQRYEEVWRYEVGSGAPYEMYHTGAYEGAIRRASLENDVLVVTRHAEGFSWFEFYTGEGQPVEVNNPKPDDAEFPVFVDQGVLSPDAGLLVYLESDSPSPNDGTWKLDLVVFDLRDGTEYRRIDIDFGDWYIERMDYDALGVAIGRIQWVEDGYTTGTPLALSLDEDAGDITEVDIPGFPSLIK